MNHKGLKSDSSEMSDKDNYGNVSLRWLRVVSVCSVLAVLILICSVVIMFFLNWSGNNGGKETESVDDTDRYQSVLYEIQALDSINGGGELSPEMMKKVLANQKYIIDQQEDIILDIRQEANNIIDKQAMWLSFWIGVIAIFGVLTPAMAEYRFRVSNKLEMRGIRDNAEKLIGEMKDAVNDCQGKMEEINDQLEEIKIHEQINNLSIAWNDNIIDRIPEGHKILKSIVCDLRDRLYHICHNKAVMSNPIKCKEILHPLLLRIYDFICKESNAVHKFASSRVIDNTKDSLRKAIELSFNPSLGDIPQLKKYLENIISNLKLLFGN